MSSFSDLVHKLIMAGVDPNELQKRFEEAIALTELWVLYGDGKWRQNLVCSKCGATYGGICHDPDMPAMTGLFSDNPAYHKNQPGVKMMPYKDWKAKNDQVAD